MDTLQYAELFLTESREHVAVINRALLTLERETSGPAASAAVAEIFRAVHTMKGMSAMMGYGVVAELAHELETVLDRARREDLTIDGDIMDVFFRSADVLEQAIEAAVAGRDLVVAPGEATASELVATLRALGAPEPLAAAPIESTLSAPGTLVRVRLAADTPLRGVRAFIIVQAMGTVGEIMGTAPAIDDLQRETFSGEFAMRVVTPLDAADIERTVRGCGNVADVQVGDDEQPVTLLHAAAVDSTAPTAPTAPAVASSDALAARPAAVRARHVRIDVRRLDNLMNLIGELVIARGRLTQIAGAIRDASLDETVTESSRLITELRDEITASRMVPVSQVFDRFPRVVRDAARAVGKQVTFVVEGKEIDLDRSMLDDIADSIVHLLRNAIDHGIEGPEVRVAAGKDPTGRVTLSAERDRSAVVIKVTDDGKGIDRQRVLARAKRDGLVDAAKHDLTEDDLLRLLARPGFSTAEQVTDLSGRGVGVDAVYTRVRALGGAMDIRSVPGAGTTMILRLPLTLAIVRAVLARVGGETYAVPLAHVSETLELDPDIIRRVQGQEVMLGRDEVLPLLRLRQLVGLPPYAASNAIEIEQIIIIDLGDRRAALVIDELSGQEEIVVKQYDGVRDGLPFFGGATLLGDGTPSLIVDVSSLL
ncbi:MAG TPA: chemotaxis protein CheA [Gemmatimonadaceae bacterium]